MAAGRARSAAPSAHEPQRKRRKTAGGDDGAAADERYFDAYSSIELHMDMIVDEARTGAYRQALERLGSHLRDRVVLDVGAGTGVLSVFAARAGARVVYAVEACARMAAIAQQFVCDNGCADRVRVLHGRVESVALPEPVDVIVSEWMGYALLYEGMWRSVLYARDHLGAPGSGPPLMMPARARLLLVPTSDEERHGERVAAWDEQHYGLDWAAVQRAAAADLASSLDVADVAPDTTMAFPVELAAFDMRTVAPAAMARVRSTFETSFLVSDVLRGLALYFCVEFDEPSGGRPVVLGTGPEHVPTHWAQTGLYCSHEPFSPSGGELIAPRARCVYVSVCALHLHTQYLAYRQRRCSRMTG